LSKYVLICYIINLFPDFSQTSKKLGELWSTVPYNEKYVSIYPTFLHIYNSYTYIQYLNIATMMLFINTNPCWTENIYKAGLHTLTVINPTVIFQITIVSKLVVSFSNLSSKLQKLNTYTWRHLKTVQI
jgi:hypothetical protein